ncbi:unnamed protein product [Pieris macdunnoughi]|uniref:Uncharacterized protein n=1 Tax=Pieris macdunnoughi TaxID=345717 RepID=A0A821UYT3_9NEOP|nr:unnamed protein product [Pieris macdunnoughi]
MFHKKNYIEERKSLQEALAGSSNGVGVRAGGRRFRRALSIVSHTFLRPQQSILRARDCPPGEDFNLVNFRHCIGAINAALVEAAATPALRASRARRRGRSPRTFLAECPLPARACALRRAYSR